MILETGSNKDWLNPTISAAVDRAFVGHARDRWDQPEDAWVLAGDWLEQRPDIVAWMRKAYWRHNKYPRKRTTTKDVSDQPEPPEGSAGSSTEGRPWKEVVM
tara:strand:+ start:289 stop:594 length:306 start_codon:yes stop_codon:yes gene_type:complete